MEIKNGFVKWDERKDIPCMFAEMEDGTRYYFKQELQNGNRIVTTSLLEFVDPMAKKQNIGLLGADGNIVIPCNNSSIQVLGEDLLLVEPAEPVSENVKEANRLRQDPLAATRLVSTPAQIKEKMNAEMSPAARYVSYDQFKDVTLCDGNGNNNLNGEYYSFVAIDNDKLYLAKNYIDTDIKVFSIPDKKIIEKEIQPAQEVVEQPVEEIITEPVAEQPVEEVATGPVVDIKTSDEVVPNGLDSIYGNDLGEEISIPTEEISTQPMEDIDMNVSFDEITEETPTEKINEESTTDVVDTYEIPEETDTEKRLKTLNELFSGANSDINAYLNSDEEKTDDVFSNTEFHEDKLENIEDEEIPHIEREPENTKELFDKLVQEKADADRELSEAKEREEKLIEENEKDKREIKNLKQKLALVTSTLQDAEKDVSKQKATIESLAMTLDLQKRKSEEYKRDLIEKDREIARLRMQKDDYDYIRSGLEGLYGKDEDSYYKVA